MGKRTGMEASWKFSLTQNTSRSMMPIATFTVDRLALVLRVFALVFLCGALGESHSFASEVESGQIKYPATATESPTPLHEMAAPHYPDSVADGWMGYPASPFSAQMVALRVMDDSSLRLVRRIALSGNFTSGDSVICRVPVKRLRFLDEAGVDYRILRPGNIASSSTPSLSLDSIGMPLDNPARWEKDIASTHWVEYWGAQGIGYGDYAKPGDCGTLSDGVAIELSPGTFSGGGVYWTYYDFLLAKPCADAITGLELHFLREERCFLGGCGNPKVGLYDWDWERWDEGIFELLDTSTPGWQSFALTSAQRAKYVRSDGAIAWDVDVGAMNETCVWWALLKYTYTENTGPGTPVVSGLPSTICGGQTVQLQASATGGPTSWYWTSGCGGSFGSRYSSSTSWTAPTGYSGYCEVGVLASNDCGAALGTKSTTVKQKPGTPSISGVPSTVCGGQTYSLSANASGNPTSWSWGSSCGGIFGSQSSSSTSWTAPAGYSGSCQFTVTAGNSCGSTSNFKSTTVSQQPGTPWISGLPGTVCGGQTIALSASASGSPTGWSWSSSCGGSFSSQSSSATNWTPPASHSGACQLSVMASNTCGSASGSQSTTVNPTPGTPAISGLPGTVCGGESYALSASASGNPTSWNWSSSCGGNFSTTTGSSTIWTAPIGHVGGCQLTVMATNNCGSTSGNTSTVVEQDGTINATSTPSGADVYLDGVHQGVSPVTFSAAAGSHNVRFSKPCYDDCTQSVSVSCGQPSNVSCALNAQSGTISATSNPSGASVYLDGVYIGISPVSFPASPGPHTVVFTKSCYDDCVQPVTVSDCSQPTTVSCTLTEQDGSIYATSNPSGADVYLDGALQGVSPVTFTASLGSHTVTFRETCYDDCDQSVNVVSCTQPTNVTCALTQHANGTISATSSPNGASVYLDGSYQGITPTTFSASPGSHLVTFTDDCYEDCTQTVDVICNETSAVDCQLTAQPDGTISATSTPSGADVHLDGVYKGVSPISFSASAGPHSVRFAKECYDDCTQSVTVICTQVAPVDCQLSSPQDGTVSATSTPSGASVYLDGSYKGITPMTFSAPTGSHLITFTEDCYDDCSQTVDVICNQTSAVDCQLTPQPDRTISATSTPSGADVYLDGVYQGVSPITFSASPGVRSVRFAKECFDDCTQTANVICNQNTSVDCQLSSQQDGTIAATSTPNGASVYLDGFYQGITPTSFPASPGSHLVTFTEMCYDDCSQTVEVVCNQTSAADCELTEQPECFAPRCSVSIPTIEFSIAQDESDAITIRISNESPTGGLDLTWEISDHVIVSTFDYLTTEDVTYPGTEFVEGLIAGEKEIAASQTIDADIEMTVQCPDDRVSEWKRSMGASSAVLYDQTDHDTTFGIISQDYGTGYSAYDAEAADDFVIPEVDESWTIESIDVPGFYPQGEGPATSVNIRLYEDLGGLPGSEVFSALNVIPISGLSDGFFAIGIDPPLVLPAGTYWVSIQPNQDYDPYGMWYWLQRTVQTSAASAWRNPGDGWETGCIDWGNRVTDCGIGQFPDLLFRLNGTIGATGCSWLSANPESGTIPAQSYEDVVITADVSGLLPGVYDCQLEIATNDPDPANNPVIIPVTVTVSLPHAQICVAPPSMEFTVHRDGSDSDILQIGNCGPQDAQDLTWAITHQSMPLAINDVLVGGNSEAGGDFASIPGPGSHQIGTSQIGNAIINLSRTTHDAPTPLWSSQLRKSTAILYDQTDNATSLAGTSQNFEAGNDAFDNQGADDFVIPVSDGSWEIESVDVLGLYSDAGGPVSSVNVWFYTDAGGLPGTEVFAALNVIPISDLTDPSFSVLLSPPAVLCAGTYWVSVQANQDFDPFGQWYWFGRSVQSNAPSAWRNPGDGFENGCVNWTEKTTCLDGHGPDNVFRLSGNIGSNECTWLSEIPSCGVVPAGGQDDVMVTVDATGLEPGTYTCNLTISSNDPDPGDNPLTIPVTLNVSACDCGIKGDVNDDMSTDPLDVTYLVNYVYLSLDALTERPDCPYPKGDMNCDDSADPLDVTYLVNYVYLSQDALCDGCAPPAAAPYIGPSMIKD